MRRTGKEKETEDDEPDEGRRGFQNKQNNILTVSFTSSGRSTCRRRTSVPSPRGVGILPLPRSLPPFRPQAAGRRARRRPPPVRRRAVPSAAGGGRDEEDEEDNNDRPINPCNEWIKQGREFVISQHLKNIKHLPPAVIKNKQTNFSAAAVLGCRALPVNSKKKKEGN